ncbi:MAG: HipA domain-containing protein [Tannerellaceae bacterium]|jgi:serine/threonine-protein kinase HipA|nr:HipA domain-containing protein [Tannerellaceae bacterium]
MAQHKEICVYLDWADRETPIFMGLLHSEMMRGKEVFSFENDPEWLKCSAFRALDPDLGQFAGKQYLPADKSNFGMFLDSSPDRWGRVLMRRREAIAARSENRPARTLSETDYLMGVYDGNRMGALRFTLSPGGEFMDNNKAMATPPWASIRNLEYASLQIEKDESREDTEYTQWLNMLIAPGSSLGGARPKANIVDRNGALWIAKFPSGHDDQDMGAWEAVVAELAKGCGIRMAESKAMKFSSKQHTFLTKRFDRTTHGQRIHFASAMTLLGYTDGADSEEGVSYLELAEWIGRYCDNVEDNLAQLWRRIVFHIAVSNCDDHLRNHGFLLTPKGWTLSPAYDINPDKQGVGLKLNISENDNSLDFDLAVSVAGYFGLSGRQANTILNDVRSSVSSWRKIATKQEISRLEQEGMAKAFRY